MSPHAAEPQLLRCLSAAMLVHVKSAQIQHMRSVIGCKGHEAFIHVHKFTLATEVYGSPLKSIDSFGFALCLKLICCSMWL